MYCVSLDEPIFVNNEGDVVTLSDVLPSDEDLEEKTIRKIMQRELIRSIPINILRIGAKRVRSEALTNRERKVLQRFRTKFKASYPEDIYSII